MLCVYRTAYGKESLAHWRQGKIRCTASHCSARVPGRAANTRLTFRVLTCFSFHQLDEIFPCVFQYTLNFPGQVGLHIPAVSKSLWEELGEHREKFSLLGGRKSRMLISRFLAPHYDHVKLLFLWVRPPQGLSSAVHHEEQWLHCLTV